MNKTRVWRVFVAGLALLAIVALVACQPQTVVVSERMVVETVVVEKEVEVERPLGEAMPTPAPAVEQPPEGAKGNGDPGTPPLASPYRANRMIIKNAELHLLMEDVGSGVDRVTQVAADTFGYILSSRTWYKGGFQYATITIGVPVDEFEGALRRLRGMAVRVQDENASGKDVSDQYVDLESRLRNLEATEVRIRTFLDQAVDVEESLRVNQQLTEVTAQIEEIKGQMSYLKDRAAYSTITVNLLPQMPTPTPAPTATPTPTPEPDVWRPDQTFRRATGVLGGILRVVGDTAIWVAVVLGPFVVPGALALWFIYRTARKRVAKDKES